MDRKFGFIISLILVVWSCKRVNEASPNVDFREYIAIGNSLTAGVSNNGLYNQSIRNAYPSLLAQQFKTVGGGNFSIALFANGQENGTGYLKLKGYNGLVPIISLDEKNNAIVTHVPPKLAKYIGNNQNLGIPFMRMTEIDDENLKSNNVFFDRFLPDNTQKMSYLKFIEPFKPTFFSCWLGNNDVLAFATSGGVRPISDKNLFRANVKKLLDQLTKNGAKGVVGNIGDVSLIPAIFLLTNLRPLVSSAKFYIQTKAGVREGTLNDYLLLPNGLSNLADLATRGVDKTKPWADNEVLDSEEVALLQEATKQFNDILKMEATSRSLAYMDANIFLRKLKAGINENGDQVSADFITGGIFSLDGAHLTAKGNAFTANEFIKTINLFYKSSIPLIDTKLYKGVEVE